MFTVLKIAATSFFYDNNLSFLSNLIFSCILLFLFEKCGLHAYNYNQHCLSQITAIWLIHSDLPTGFVLTETQQCHQDFFYLFALFLRRDLIIICFCRFLSKQGFQFTRQIFVFLAACLPKIELNFFSKAAWVLTGNILSQRSNLNCSQSIVHYHIKFFKFCFENSIYHMMITETSFQGICPHK